MTHAAAQEAGRLLAQGEPLLAYNALQDGLAGLPDDPRLRQLLGLSLARAGDPLQASRVLARLAGEGFRDAETLGLLARTHKDLAQQSPSAEARTRHLAAAFDLYREAHDFAVARGDAAAATYAGINVAAVAALGGDLAAARAMAAAVRRLCDANPLTQPDLWREATLGEAALILGDAAAARDHYGQARTLAAGRYGDLGSTRRQARLVASVLPGEAGWVDEVLRIPPVCMYTGHMIDLPGRPAPRFPPAREAEIGARIREQLARLRPAAVYGSGACGSDLLYLEAARELGAETHIVLPFQPADFVPGSVACVPGDWTARFEQALAAASTVTVTSDHRARGSDSPYEYANLVLCGQARLRSQALDTDLVGLGAWDGRDTGGVGGAASLVRLWRERRFRFDELLIETLAGSPIATSRPAGIVESLPDGFTHGIRAMLFADAVGFSRLSEDQIPVFVTHFLGAVAGLNRRTRHVPEHVESTGDGLYLVFGGPLAAGYYALELSALVASTDWSALGLPAGLNVRIALHCGPVYCGTNPLTGAPIYTGPHTSRAARIEPVTPPGQVYASAAFAAVAAALGADDLSLTYIGRMPLPKDYGTLALYHLREQGLREGTGR